MTRPSLTTFLETIEAWTRLATDEEVGSLARLVAAERERRALAVRATESGQGDPTPPPSADRESS